MKLIQEIGSYAGFAAVVGLAVLSALYFSQARDVRRLRDWAGRAPERDAEARSRVSAVSQARPSVVAQPAQAAKAAAAGGNSSGAATPAAKPVTAAAAGASPVSAAAGGPPRAISGVASPSRTAPRTASGQTQILSAKSQLPPERWYRRLAPRYVALIIAGVLVVGGGITVGVLQLLKNDSGAPSKAGTGKPTALGQDNGGGGGNNPPTAAPIIPSSVRVAVLNGTTVPGLAATYKDRLTSLGFVNDATGNSPVQRAETVVLYEPGKKRQAALVRRKLKLGNIEQIDHNSRALAPNAAVVVVVGLNAAK